MKTVTNKMMLVFYTMMFFLCSNCHFSYASVYYEDDHKEVMNIAAKLKNMKTYSFRNRITLSFENGQIDRTVTQVYMDRVNKRLFYSNESEVLLLTSKWAYQVNHDEKTIGVFNISAYKNKYQEFANNIDDVFAIDVFGEFVDAVLGKHAVVTSSVKEGSVVHYELEFPQLNPSMKMTLAFDYKTGMPSYMKVYMEVPYADQTIKQEVYCDMYSTFIQESTFDLNKYFRIKDKKVNLIQYRNYALTTLL